MEYVPLLVAIVGLGFAIARAVHASRLAVDPDAFGAALERCLRTGHPERGLKICAAVGHAPLAAATAALLEKRAFPASTSEDDARATLRDAFVRAFVEKATPLATYRFAAWLALLLLVLPVVHGLVASVLAMRLVAVAVIGLAVLGWTARTVAKTLDGGPRVLERLLPHAVPLALGTTSTYRSPDLGPIEAPEPTADAVVLVVERDGAREGTRTFEQPIVKIGRAATSHLQLDHETVGRMHAVIERDADGVSIIDLGNASGTSVNGERVNKAALAHGDVVSIGPFCLTVGIGARVTPAAEPARETDDPRTWGRLAALFYGFDQRSPDLFYEVVQSCIASRARVAKVRREVGSPRFVVAVLTERSDDLAATRRRVEEEAPALYRSYATPAADIGPDAIYTVETSTHGKLLAELVAGEVAVLATRTVAEDPRSASPSP
ncbi:MAG: FHA domain-containing protein [Myxococcales bacterium]|nr:FHA domain-containing protein [Myxococcales bacterium]